MRYLVGFVIKDAKDVHDAKMKFCEKVAKASPATMAEIDCINVDEPDERKIDADHADGAFTLLGATIDLLRKIDDDDVATALGILLNEVFYDLEGAGCEMVIGEGKS